MNDPRTVRPRALITGAAGLFASKIVDKLGKHYDLVLTDLKGKKGSPIAPLNLLDYQAVKQVMEGIDVVLHLAIAKAADLEALSDSEYADESIRANIIATQHVLEAAAVQGVSRVLLFCSQMASVGWPGRPCVGTDLPPRPADLYGATKLFCEQLGELYARMNQLPVACLRVGEPWPRGFESDAWKMKSRNGRAVLVHFDDIYRCIECALSARNVLYSVTDCLSYTDLNGKELPPNPIGYEPTWYFDENGATELESNHTGSISKRLRIAAIITCFHKGSHADVILRRWFESFPADEEWGWSGPKTELSGAYLDQREDNDIGVEFFQTNNVPLHDTVTDALTLGTGKLAVDGVILIGEHGNYPINEIGQQLYPRKELFDRIVDVFRDSGRAVPIFNDKHLSWNEEWAHEMCATAWDLRFLLFAGSSIPLCPLTPEIQIPEGEFVEEAVVLFYGPDESYGFHSLEFAQAILDGQQGAKFGMHATTAWCGDEVWEQMEAGTWSKELFDRALAAVDPASGQIEPGNYRENIRKNEKQLSAFQLKYFWGPTLTHINMTGHLETWAIGMRLTNGEILAAYPTVLDAEFFHPHFAALSNMIQETFLTGRAPHYLQRSLCTTLSVAEFMRALATPGEEIFMRGPFVSYDGGACYRNPRKLRPK
jgi:dTDP-4-dehydrorhamnose reductase